MNKILAGRYAVEKVIGRGGMCEVYLARDQRLHKWWAVKRQMPVEQSSAEESVKDEATLLSSLNHPALPMVADFFEEEGFEHLVLEFCEGTTLANKLEQQALPTGEALDIVRQLGEVLHYLHSRPEPIIYRDLKPHNVIVSPDLRVKLIDFGIARARRENRYDDTQALGTPGYAAPEQYGKGTSDQRTDIFGLGATLHHALTGVHPAQNPFSFPPLSLYCPELPLSLERLVDRAVSLKPEERHQTVEDFLKALEAVCRHRDMRRFLSEESSNEGSVGETPVDVQIELTEKKLQIEDLGEKIVDLEESIRFLEAELSSERDRVRGLLAKNSVEQKGVSLELERTRATLALKEREVETEREERLEIEKVLSESKATARTLEVNLLRYEEAFRRAGAESQRLIAERDAEIQRLAHRCQELEMSCRVSGERVEKVERYLLELSKTDHKLELSHRELLELEKTNRRLQTRVEEAERSQQSATGQSEALRLEALAIIEAQKRGEQIELSEPLPANPDSGLAEVTLKKSVTQLEQALEESCRLWLKAEARLTQPEI